MELTHLATNTTVTIAAQVQAIHIPFHHSNAICSSVLFNLRSLFILHCASVVHTFFHTFSTEKRRMGNIYIWMLLLLCFIVEWR